MAEASFIRDVNLEHELLLSFNEKWIEELKNQYL